LLLVLYFSYRTFDFSAKKNFGTLKPPHENFLRTPLLSGAKNGRVSQEKKRKNLAVLAKLPRLKLFFSAKLLSSNVTRVALTRAPENVGDNHDISFEKHFSHSDWLTILTCYFSGVFVCNLWFLRIVRVNVVSCQVTI